LINPSFKNTRVIDLSGGVVGGEKFFKIIARSERGGRLVSGGDNIGVDFDGPEFIKATIFDFKDGSYEVRYIVYRRGIYDVKVTLNGQQIQGSPFQVEFYPLDQPDPIKSTAIGLVSG